MPSLVSLVENKCDLATNIVKIIHNPSENEESTKKEIVICTKLFVSQSGLQNIKVQELVELIETQLIFGVDRIIFEVKDVDLEILIYFLVSDQNFF